MVEPYPTEKWWSESQLELWHSQLNGKTCSKALTSVCLNHRKRSVNSQFDSRRWTWAYCSWLERVPQLPQFRRSAEMFWAPIQLHVLVALVPQMDPWWFLIAVELGSFSSMIFPAINLHLSQIRWIFPYFPWEFLHFNTWWLSLVLNFPAKDCLSIVTT